MDSKRDARLRAAIQRHFAKAEPKRASVAQAFVKAARCARNGEGSTTVWSQRYATCASTYRALAHEQHAQVAMAQHAVASKAPVTTLSTPLGRIPAYAEVVHELETARALYEAMSAELDTGKVVKVEKVRSSGSLVKLVDDHDCYEESENAYLLKAMRVRIERLEERKQAIEGQAAGLLADAILKQDRRYGRDSGERAVKVGRPLWGPTKPKDPRPDREGRALGFVREHRG